MDALAFSTSAASFWTTQCTPSRSSSMMQRRAFARRRRATPRMCEEPLTAAEKTRRALAESKPLVKFRREVDYLDDDTSFKYTKGVESGIDVWLVTGVLFFVVPIVGFAIGVATGNIDITPR